MTGNHIVEAATLAGAAEAEVKRAARVAALAEMVAEEMGDAAAAEVVAEMEQMAAADKDWRTNGKLKSH